MSADRRQERNARIVQALRDGIRDNELVELCKREWDPHVGLDLAANDKQCRPAPADFGPVLMQRRTLSPPAPVPAVLYVLSAHDYGDHSIIGAFSSEELAIAKARELAFTKGGRRRRENYQYWIDECALNGESLGDWQVAL